MENTKTIDIEGMRESRRKIIANQPKFGSPNSHTARRNARRSAKNLEKKIYRARREN